MTTEEYLQTAETLKPTELIYGVLRAADSPLAPHQAAVLDLSLSLVSHVRERRLGEIWISPFDVILDATRHLDERASDLKDGADLVHCPGCAQGKCREGLLRWRDQSPGTRFHSADASEHNGVPGQGFGCTVTARDAGLSVLTAAGGLGQSHAIDPTADWNQKKRFDISTTGPYSASRMTSLAHRHHHHHHTGDVSTEAFY